MLERDIQNNILAWLRKEFPGACVFKIHEDSVFGTIGLPDILFIWDGEVYFFEVKKPGEEPTPIQRSIINKIRNNRVLVNVVSSLDQVKEIVRH